MNRTNRTLRFFLTLCGILAAAIGESFGANQDADSQLWNEARLTYDISEQFDVFTAGSYRLTDNFSAFTRAAGRIGGSWSPIPNVSITPSYLYAANNPWTSNSSPENRLCLLTAYRIPIRTSMLTLANTTEYRMSQGLPNSWWLRPRVTFANPVGPDKWGLGAFVSDEIFYNNAREVFAQDRVFAGFAEKFNDNLTVELYYCRRIQMNSNTTNANVICIDFKITFGKTGAGPFEPDFE